MPDERQTQLTDDGPAGATFSDDREYRYRLWRTWNAESPVCAFVMLNPSTADETTLDPTCRRCKDYAERWGYGTLLVGNIFAVRATEPANMKAHDEPVGPENDRHLQAICDDADFVVAAWGAHGSYRDRAREVAQTLDANLHALATTKDGHPRHPLYLSKDLEPEPWSVDELDD